MEKFEGVDNLVAEMNFDEEPADSNNAEAGMRYTWNGTEISYDEYTEIMQRDFRCRSKYKRSVNGQDIIVPTQVVMAVSLSIIGAVRV